MVRRQQIVGVADVIYINALVWPKKKATEVAFVSNRVGSERV